MNVISMEKQEKKKENEKLGRTDSLMGDLNRESSVGLKRKSAFDMVDFESGETKIEDFDGSFNSLKNFAYSNDAGYTK